MQCLSLVLLIEMLGGDSVNAVADEIRVFAAVFWPLVSCGDLFLLLCLIVGAKLGPVCCC